MNQHQIMRHLLGLRTDEEGTLYVKHENFKLRAYEYELGIEIIKCIYPDREMWNNEEKHTLFGITIRINFYDPYVMRLWKDTHI